MLASPVTPPIQFGLDRVSEFLQSVGTKPIVRNQSKPSKYEIIPSRSLSIPAPLG